MLRRVPRKVEPVDSVTAYYEHHIAKAKGICENCKLPYPAYEIWRQFAAQCHILDKDGFPEVKLELNNHWEGCLACHGNFDTAPTHIVEAMPILPVLRQRLKTFIEKVSPNNHNKIPRYLLCLNLDS